MTRDAAETATDDAPTPAPRAGVGARLRGLPGWTLTGGMAALVGLVAALTRFPRLGSAPPGFLIDEAATALFAESINRQHLPLFFGGGTPDVQEPFFMYVMKWTGTLFGWNVYGARAAAALCGVGVAVACALWFGRALGRGWGLAGGLLVATSFWQLMFSRQAIRPISMPLCAAAGLWCLWEGLECPAAARTLGLPRRLLWHAAAGAAFGLGLYTYIAFRLVVPAALLVGALLLWNRRAGDRRVDARGLALAGGVLVLVALPLGGYYVKHPHDFWRRAEQVRDQEGGASVLHDPLAAGRGYLVTLRSFVWDGYAAPNVNQPGRPILDPLLALWALAGLALALRHPLRPLNGVALLWFAIFSVPSALSSPGHPVRELGATPAVFLFPLLAMRAAISSMRSWDMSRATDAAAGMPPARPWRGLPGLATLALVALSIVGSAAWSLYDYFHVWAPSNAAYVAFEGDVRDSLTAIDHLPNDGAPVYYSTWTLDRLVNYLAPDRPARAFDGRATLLVPAQGGGYLVYPTVTAPDPQLLRYLGPAPLATGHSPAGAVAYQVWTLGEAQRTALPYTIPTLAFDGDVALLGFEIAPVIPLDAQGNPTPTPPGRPVALTLVWRVPADATPRTLRVRLTPAPGAVSASGNIGPPTTADADIGPSPPQLLTSPAGELIITRVVVPFPEGVDIADAEVALSTDPAAGPDAPPFGDFVYLNRIQYTLSTP